jgi:alpha-L-rhamnosidase
MTLADETAPASAPGGAPGEIAFQPVQWSACMIAAPSTIATAPVLNRELSLEEGHGAVQRAEWHVSAFGIVEPHIDGVPVSDELFTPGWTSYQWRLRYRSFDVSHLVRDGSRLSLELGNGWWRGRLTWVGIGAVYGDNLGAIAQLEITYEDGHVQVVGTDSSWRATGSDVVSDDLYDGQAVDARRRRCSDDAEQAVEVLPFEPSCLVPFEGPPVRRQEVLRAKRVWTSPTGRTLVDFGQNLVGFVRFEVRGEAGTEIVIRHAEVLEEGELSTRPLRSAKATDRLVLSGELDHFEPTRTFHGFRYVEVTGWPGELSLDAIEAVVVHTDLRRTGTFECSEPLLNRLHENVVWSLKGNSLAVPTDCPQRDERLGWTGDLAVFAPTATFLYDVSGFLQGWLRDLAAEQRAHGTVPYVVPDVLRILAERRAPEMLDPDNPNRVNAVTAIWGDAAVWVPWALWLSYGDRAALAESYPSMLGHVRQSAAQRSANGLWDTGFQFGDWLDPSAPPDRPQDGRTSTAVVATACLFRSACMTRDAAEVLDRPDHGELATLASEVRAAFRAHYVKADGSIECDSPTAYALAIVFGLLEEEERAAAGARLVSLVRDAGHRIETGFAGTAFLLDALSTTGHFDDAYALLLQQECPSWLYQVRMGATTMWERWDSLLPDGTVNPGEMTSFNHYAFGAVADWMHRNIGGLTASEPGYRSFLVAPQPGGGITQAATRHDSPFGTIDLSWRLDGDAGELAVMVPEGTTALLRLPSGDEEPLSAGRHVRTWHQ